MPAGRQHPVRVFKSDRPRSGQKKSGLGTSIVKALAQQLEAQVEVLSGPTGITVSITHTTFAAHFPAAA